MVSSFKHFIRVSNYGLISGMSSPIASLASPFQTVAVVGKHGATGAVASLTELVDFLKQNGHNVVLETETAQAFPDGDVVAMTAAEIGQHADLAIVVGGDGTVLGIARQLAPFSVPLIGINQGRLGFMTDIPQERMLPLLAAMLAGELESEQRSLLSGTVTRDGQRIFEEVAVNDIVVSRGAGSGMVELRVEVDGHFMYNQRSDGLIVATPTGSTAYAMSAGGPIMHPELGGIVLVPIAPHALSNRPIVLSDHCEIVIELASGLDCSVNFDMQSFTSLQQYDRIVVQRSAHTIRFLHPRGWSYYNTLREKLHWNEYPSVLGQLK